MRAPKTDWLNWESDLLNQGYLHIAGLDEAGCGPLAGPVVAGAVILPQGLELPLLNDSKKVSEPNRLLLYEQITTTCDYGVGEVSPEEIDRLNIRQATYLAMQRAVANLSQLPDFLLVDAWHLSFWSGSQEAVVKGDSKVRSIAAASIIAKTHRDRLMYDADRLYPQYEFARHKGYPTARHYELLRAHGACPLHRQSFLKKFWQQELTQSDTNVE